MRRQHRQGLARLVLSGGSAFGLEAAAGLTSWLAVRGRGFVDRRVLHPDRHRAPSCTTSPMAATRPGASAALSARWPCGGRGGRPGDSRWAMPGPALGPWPARSRVGSARPRPSTGPPAITVAALVAVNPVGSVTMPGSPTMWAWHLEQAGELGGQSPPTGRHRPCLRDQGGIGHNTTIGVSRPTPPSTRAAAAAGGDGAGRLRLRHPPDPHPSRR